MGVKFNLAALLDKLSLKKLILSSPTAHLPGELTLEDLVITFGEKKLLDINKIKFAYPQVSFDSFRLIELALSFSQELLSQLKPLYEKKLKQYRIEISVAFLPGKIHLDGFYQMGVVIPFNLTLIPEIREGKIVLLIDQSSVAVLPMPHFLQNLITEIIFSLSKSKYLSSPDGKEIIINHQEIPQLSGLKFTEIRVGEGNISLLAGD